MAYYATGHGTALQYRFCFRAALVAPPPYISGADMRPPLPLHVLPADLNPAQDVPEGVGTSNAPKSSLLETGTCELS